MIYQVELGPGTSPHPATIVGIDPVHPIAAPPQMAQSRWQYRRVGQGDIYLEDGVVDHVYASHVLEHIPAGQPRLDVFNEAWRVLKPGGAFTMIMPLIGVTGYGLVERSEAWADPTHVSQWWMPESLTYFTDEQPACAEYGIQPWKRLGPKLNEVQATEALAKDEDLGTFWAVRGGWECVARLVKP